MAKIDDTLVDNQLIFPSEDDLKDTFDFMVLDDKQTPEVRRRVFGCHRWLKPRRIRTSRGLRGLQLRSLTKEFAASPP